MEIIKVAITLVLFVIVLFLLNKKFAPAVTLTAVGFVAIVIGVLINGYDLLEDKTTGILLFDVFEYFRASPVVNTLGTMGVRIMSILAYVAYMEHLKATKMFALIVSKPIMMIKNKPLLAAGVFILTALLIIAIPNGTGRMAILLGTVYPVMLACGVSRPTAAVAIFAGAMYSWGPINPKILTAAAYMGTEVNMAEYFLTVEWMWDIIALGVGAVVFVITSRFFDKRENASAGEGVFSGLSVESLGAPKWYAILPLVPVVFIIIFGGSIPGLPKLEIAAIQFMCFFFVLLFITIISKNKKEAWNDGTVFFTNMGTAMGRIVMVMIAALTFGAGITALGGINVIMQPVMEMGGTNPAIFIVLTAVLAVIVGAISASDYVSNSILGPVYTSFAESTGVNIYALLMIPVNAVQMSIAFTPATAHVALISEGAEVPINTIIKRAALPVFCSIIVYVVGAVVMA